jgi:hypothetical protein
LSDLDLHVRELDPHGLRVPAAVLAVVPGKAAGSM